MSTPKEWGDSIELRAAQRFIDNKGQPPEKPKPPPKAWTYCLGPIDFPGGEYDAREVSFSTHAHYPYDTALIVMDYPDGRVVEHPLMKTEDGRWLEILDGDGEKDEVGQGQDEEEASLGSAGDRGAAEEGPEHLGQHPR